jgi:5-methylcytosine-specific restriction endonuclease McrBC GTP-binding regulatory subunit McrB
VGRWCSDLEFDDSMCKCKEAIEKISIGYAKCNYVTKQMLACNPIVSKTSTKLASNPIVSKTSTKFTSINDVTALADPNLTF